MYCDIRVISLVGKEWRYSCSSTWSIIISEFHEWKKFLPIVLLVIAVNLEVLFQCLVGAFGLSVAFRVVSRGEVKSHVESFSERSEEVRDELHSAVGGDVGWYSVLRKHMKYEQLGELHGSDCVVGRNKD